MDIFNEFVDNYKATTSGFNTFGKVILAFVLAFIFINVIIAIIALITSS